MINEYSAISNINSDYIPSNTSFNLNIMGSQRLFNKPQNYLNTNSITNVL